MLDIGVSVLPKLPRDAGDRNRTSPFAFTGNKFEFRAVSARGRTSRSRRPASTSRWPSRSTTWPTELEAALGKGQASKTRSRALLKKTIKQHKRIIFNGNGYSEEWQKEAGKRGLLNLKNTVDALPEIVKPDVVKTFEKFKILTERELHARYEVNLETYCKTINVEAQLMVLMANRYILPAALEYQRRVADSVSRGQGGRRHEQGRQEAARSARQARRPVPGRRPTRWPTRSSTRARRPRSTPSTCATRSCRRWRRCAELGDQIELIVPHELWPLPTSREMLFIK